MLSEYCTWVRNYHTSYTNHILWHLADQHIWSLGLVVKHDHDDDGSSNGDETHPHAYCPQCHGHAMGQGSTPGFESTLLRNSLCSFVAGIEKENSYTISIDLKIYSSNSKHPLSRIPLSSSTIYPLICFIIIIIIIIIIIQTNLISKHSNS